jgi:hypothetical protein
MSRKSPKRSSRPFRMACAAECPDEELFWQAQASAGPQQAAMRAVGAPLLRAAILGGVAPHRTGTGGVRLQNYYRYITAAPVMERR